MVSLPSGMSIPSFAVPQNVAHKEIHIRPCLAASLAFSSRDRMSSEPTKQRTVRVSWSRRSTWYWQQAISTPPYHLTGKGHRIQGPKAQLTFPRLEKDSDPGRMAIGLTSNAAGNSLAKKPGCTISDLLAGWLKRTSTDRHRPPQVSVWLSVGQRK